MDYTRRLFSNVGKLRNLRMFVTHFMNHTGFQIALAIGLIGLLPSATHLQQPTYPKEIRGYKVERAAVEMKKTTKDAQPFESDPDNLIRFGEVRLASATPVGIKMEIPIVVAPVTQKGHVDFLVFEDIVVNGTPVEIDEYKHEFDLPNHHELELKHPLRFTINTPNLMLAALSEWTNSKERWPVTGRVYVFGRYKKFLMTFKRTIPVELDLTMRNPLHK